MLRCDIRSPKSEIMISANPRGQTIPTTSYLLLPKIIDKEEFKYMNMARTVHYLITFPTHGDGFPFSSSKWGSRDIHYDGLLDFKV